jgi:hypothetical protein
VTAAHASTASTSARHSRPNGRLRRFAIDRGQGGGAAGWAAIGQAAGVTLRALFTSTGVTGTSW